MSRNTFELDPVEDPREFLEEFSKGPLYTAWDLECAEIHLVAFCGVDPARAKILADKAMRSHPK